jgi:hypothetical protein
MRTPKRVMMSTAILGALLGMLWMPAARADQTGQSDGGANSAGGYTARVSILFTGDVGRRGGGVHEVRVHPTCWWAPAAGPYTDAVAMLAWYDEVTDGQQSRGIVDQYGPRKVWADAAKEAKDGKQLSWYHAYCVDPKNYAKFGLGVVQEVDPVEGNPTNWVNFQYRAFAAGEPIPAPMVSTQELAEAARRAMFIPAPATDRNPKIQAAGAPTLVGLPTWFWVTDPASVGGETGTRKIRAELQGAAVPTWAQVSASITGGGLQLNSPAGGATCGPAQATTKYADGKPDSAGCTVQFTHASVGMPNGYTVRASTNWQAIWNGSDGNGGTLANLAREVTAQVPVAEVQDVVTH